MQQKSVKNPSRTQQSGGETNAPAKRTLLQDPVTKNFLSASIFAASLTALLRYIDAAQRLPQNLRQPLYWTCVCVMVITLVQFGFNTVRLLQEKHQTDVQNEKSERELKEIRDNIEKEKLHTQLIVAQEERLQLEARISPLSATPKVANIRPNPHETQAVVSHPEQLSDVPVLDTTQYNDLPLQQQILGLQGEPNNG